MSGLRLSALALIALATLWLALVAVSTGASAQAEQPSTAPADTSGAAVREIAIEGGIGPAVSAYITDEIEQAQADGVELIVLRLDTPGGLDGAMRDIVKAVLASPVPIAGFVGPSGARAASAGTYILYATHIAAMAPATNLGAATPVSMGGGAPAAPGGNEDGQGSDQSDGQSSDQSSDNGDANAGSNATADNATAKRRKAVNDAVAYIRGLAERRGRNADWAERAVREGVSLSAEQALEQNVIDLMAPNVSALLEDIDGREVDTAAGVQTLNVANAEVEVREPGWRTELLAVITNPTIAYLLFMVGIYGLILEGLNPGAAVPGVVGGISLLCALFAFQLLPIDYAGLGLMALGAGLMVAELFAPSFGILGMGGIAAFTFGSVMLMDTDVPGFEIPFGIIAALALASALLLIGTLWLFFRSRRRRIETGHEGLVGSRATALAGFENEGRVLLHGESWRAESERPVAEGDPLIVTGVDGLKVFVRPMQADEDGPHSQRTDRR